MRLDIIDSIHEAHQGITKYLTRASTSILHNLMSDQSEYIYNIDELALVRYLVMPWCTSLMLSIMSSLIARGITIRYIIVVRHVNSDQADGVQLSLVHKYHRCQQNIWWFLHSRLVPGRDLRSWVVALHCKVYQILIVIDYFARWIESNVFVMSLQSVVYVMKIFASHGIPNIINSDNGLQFRAAIFAFRGRIKSSNNTLYSQFMLCRESVGLW